LHSIIAYYFLMLKLSLISWTEKIACLSGNSLKISTIKRSGKSKKDIQHKRQVKNHKRKNNNPLNIIQKTNEKTA